MTAAAATVQSQTDNTAENYNPIKGRTFNPTPRIVDKRKDLLSSTKRVYGYLCGCYGKDGLVCPKVPTIADHLGLSVPTVTRAIFTLKQKKLIDTIPTGRASRYIFLDPDQAENPVHKIVDQVSVNSPKMIEQVNQNDRAGQSKCDEQKPVTPIYKKEPSKKKTTTRRVVVSLADDEDVKTCLDVIPQQHKTPSTEKIIRISLTSHSVEEVMTAIQYANAKATKNYGAYLNLTLKHNYAEGWMPPAIQRAKVTADTAKIEASIRAEKQDAEAQADTRAALAGSWLSMPESDRAVVRAEYLQQCNKFQSKKARLMSDGKLAASLGFRLFLEARDSK